MLIDAFADNWLDDLESYAAGIAETKNLYLLLDGVCVPGLHKLVGHGGKAILFASLPACTKEVEDASPFLIPFVPADKQLRLLLPRCDRWPMLSAIETSESISQLAERLAAWCVVEADGQRFNFRFADTRRLPAIFATLSATQRMQFVGPASRWAYIARDGQWHELPVEGAGSDIATNPELDDGQFATLAGDSQTDEYIALMDYRGNDVFKYPSRTHALLDCALRAARTANLPEDELYDWCEWFWQQDQLGDDSALVGMLQKWWAKPSK